MALGLLGCVDTVQENAPWNTTAIPVVYSVISPGLPVEVYLGKTINSNLSTDNNPFPEARVFICGADSMWIELTRQSADTAIYNDKEKKLQIEKGKIYFMRIKLNDKVLHAQTTVPNQAGIINDAKCSFPDTTSGSSGGILNINGVDVDCIICWLSVKYSLPNDKEYGCYLSAFSNELGSAPNLTTGTYLDDTFFCPKDSASFLLSMMTTDKMFAKFRLSKYISPYLLSNGGLAGVLELYGGVLPNFSNIENGVGVFGSYLLTSKQVNVSKTN